MRKGGLVSGACHILDLTCNVQPLAVSLDATDHLSRSIIDHALRILKGTNFTSGLSVEHAQSRSSSLRSSIALSTFERPALAVEDMILGENRGN